MIGKFTFLILFTSYVTTVYGQQTWPTWCGKPYELGSPDVPVYGQFPIPSFSSQTLMRLGCAQTIRPYLEGEELASVTVDASLTNLELVGAKPLNELYLPLELTILYQEEVLAVGSLLPNSTTDLEFPLSRFAPQKEAYNLTCTARSFDGELFSTTANLTYLPATNNSVVKMDARTGFSLVRSNGTGTFEPKFFMGFYTDFGALAANTNMLYEMKALGINVIDTYADVTTINPYNITQLEMILSIMAELDIWLMYGMRYVYQNSTEVMIETEMIKSFSHLLSEYTGDEPDGTSDPLNATSIARDVIMEVDGYHPVSLVLNCYDYYFTEYASGADILCADPYPFGINPNYSVQWYTVVNTSYGDCGCDDCEGNPQDISKRFDAFSERLFILDEYRSKSKCGVLQGFGATEYWSIIPSTLQYVVSAVVSINHGTTTLLSWNWVDGTVQPSAQIRNATGIIGTQLLPAITPVLANPLAKREVLAYETIDLAKWVTETSTLVLGTNMENATETLTISGFPLFSKVEQIMNTGAEVTLTWDGKLELSMTPYGSVAFFINSL